MMSPLPMCKSTEKAPVNCSLIDPKVTHSGDTSTQPPGTQATTFALKNFEVRQA